LLAVSSPPGVVVTASVVASVVDTMMTLFPFLQDGRNIMLTFGTGSKSLVIKSDGRPTQIAGFF
jgi:hypothetical protein